MVADTARAGFLDRMKGQRHEKLSIRVANMSAQGSVTRWVTALQGGDQAAAQPLWERYHRQLVALARQKIRGLPRRQADEEDVVQNAFQSFFRGLEKGRFPQLADRDNLWRLLVVITARKALDQAAYERAVRRGGGTSSEQLRMTITAQQWGESALEQIVGQEPTPEFAAQVAEEYRRLLDLLAEPSLQRVAVWKMEGLTNDEIADRLQCSRRTIARKLDAIRTIWNHESADHSHLRHGEIGESCPEKQTTP